MEIRDTIYIFGFVFCGIPLIGLVVALVEICLR